jgi:hypothetical protein
MRLSTDDGDAPAVATDAAEANTVVIVLNFKVLHS